LYLALSFDLVTLVANRHIVHQSNQLRLGVVIARSSLSSVGQGQGLPPLYRRSASGALPPLRSGQVSLDEAEHSLRNRAASVATLRWHHPGMPFGFTGIPNFDWKSDNQLRVAPTVDRDHPGIMTALPSESAITFGGNPRYRRRVENRCSGDLGFQQRTHFICRAPKQLRCPHISGFRRLLL
jgi:hypothetical protein